MPVNEAVGFLASIPSSVACPVVPPRARNYPILQFELSMARHSSLQLESAHTPMLVLNAAMWSSIPRSLVVPALPTLTEFNPHRNSRTFFTSGEWSFLTFPFLDLTLWIPRGIPVVWIFGILSRPEPSLIQSDSPPSVVASSFAAQPNSPFNWPARSVFETWKLVLSRFELHSSVAPSPQMASMAYLWNLQTRPV